MAKFFPKEIEEKVDGLTYKSDYMLPVKAYISKYAQSKGTNAGVVNVIGDSISVGNAATSNSKQYVSILRENIFRVTNGGVGAGYETVINFQEKPSDITYSGTVGYGTLGPIRKSLVMTVGSTITFTRKAKYVDVLYHKTPTSGSIEVRLNGNLVKTINCTGTDTQDVWTLLESGGTPTNVNPQDTDVYELRCITANVELTGLTTLLQSGYQDTIYFNRMAVSGYVTGDFLNTGQLDSILRVGRFNDSTRQSLFVLAVGVNDIFSFKAVSSTQYKTNLRTIVEYLQSNNQLVVLVVPEHADENLWAPPIEPYENYKTKLLELAKENKVGVIDLSQIDYKGMGMYNDGIHINDKGHYLQSQIFSKALGIEVSIPPIPIATTVKANSVTVEVSSFTANGSNMLKTVAIPTNAMITGIYIKNKTNGLVVPYQDVTDYPNNIGLSYQRDYPSVGFALYYVTAGGFCKTGRGSLGSLLTNTASNAQVIIEYITP